MIDDPTGNGTEDLTEMLTEIGADHDTVQQAARLYVLGRTAFTPPGTLRQELVQAAGGSEPVEEVIGPMSRHSPALAAGALIVLSEAWQDEGERAAVRQALRDASSQLPVVEASIAAVVVMYGLYLRATGNRKASRTVIRQREDGSYTWIHEDEFYSAFEPLRAAADLLDRITLRLHAAPDPATGPGGIQAAALAAPQPSGNGNAAAPAPTRKPRVRLGFAMDLIGYSTRPEPLQDAAQRRIMALTQAILDEVNAQVPAEDIQEAGDAVKVFLPEQTDGIRAVTALTEGLAHRLHQDNLRNSDQLRLRVAVALGLTRRGALGFPGQTANSLGRLVDSAQLRTAAVESSGSSLVVLLSDFVFDTFIGPGYTYLDPDRFRPMLIEEKGYQANAWLWLSEN